MRVLVMFKSRDYYVDFSLSELKSLLTVIDIDIFQAFSCEFNLMGKATPTKLQDINRLTIKRYPFVNLYIPENKAQQLKYLISRSISIKTV